MELSTTGSGAVSRPSVLLVEDDRELSARVAEYLQQQGLATEVEGRGDRAVARILASRPDLVVLDRMLPGKDGLAVCREVRDAYRGPILMLTAHGGESDEVLGLETGADDYMAKPVRPRLLLARLRALLRRPDASPGPKGERVQVGDLTIEPALRRACLRGEPLALTSGELDLLLLLASHAGKIVSRRVLYQALRGTEQDDFDRSIDLMVSRLRHKLRGACDAPSAIKTVRGAGYLYATG